MSQKESEWEERFLDEFTKGDDFIAPNMRASYIIPFISNLLSQREKEIAEEVEKLGGYSNFKEKVLKIILKH